MSRTIPISRWRTSKNGKDSLKKRYRNLSRIFFKGCQALDPEKKEEHFAIDEV